MKKLISIFCNNLYPNNFSDNLIDPPAAFDVVGGGMNVTYYHFEELDKYKRQLTHKYNTLDSVRQSFIEEIINFLEPSIEENKKILESINLYALNFIDYLNNIKGISSKEKLNIVHKAILLIEASNSYLDIENALIKASNTHKTLPLQSPGAFKNFANDNTIYFEKLRSQLTCYLDYWETRLAID